MQLLGDFTIRPEQAPALWTPPAVRRFLHLAVKVTGLHAISPYRVLRHEEENGLHLDGHVMIAESHIHVTLYLALGCGFVDVFSCRDLVDGGILSALEETLLTPDAVVKVRILARGDLPQKEG